MNMTYPDAIFGAAVVWAFAWMFRGFLK